MAGGIVYLSAPSLATFGGIMTDFYIANCSRKSHSLAYTCPEKVGIIRVTIDPLSQKQYSISTQEMNAIIEQHSKYGFIEHTRVGAGFSGLCYSIGKPIDIDSILNADQIMINDAIELSDKMRAKTAKSIFNNDGAGSRLQSISITENTPVPTGYEERPTNSFEVEVTNQGIIAKRTRGAKKKVIKDD